jgi:hypothetical protein
MRLIYSPIETGRNIMKFEVVRSIFEHTLDCESRVSTAINLGCSISSTRS